MFDSWLNRRMRDLKLTPTVFARQIGLTPQATGRWRRGDSLPPGTRVPALSLILGVPEADLRQRIARSRKASGQRAPGQPARVVTKTPKASA